MGNDQRNTSKKNKSPSNSNTNNNVEKPKQPQRGLGVAQLEKIRLHSQLATCGFIPPHHFPPFPSHFPTSTFQEEMRLQAAYHQATLQSSATPFGYGPPPGYPHPPNNFMMGFGEHMERTGNIRFGESQPSIMTPRWNPNNNNVVAVPENHHYVQPQGMVTRHLLSNVEQNNKRADIFESKGSSSSQNSESRTKNEDINLELRL